MKPGRQRPDGRIEQLGPIPERQERLLNHLFGDLPIRGQADRRREDRVDVPIVERRQGRLRASGDRPDEIGLGLLGVTVA